MITPAYSQLMGAETAHLTLKLDTSEPIELGNFVGSFTSLANEFERFVKEEYPGHEASPVIYVKEVRSGCIEADLFTNVSIVAAHAVAHMDQILVLEDFVKRWGDRFNRLLRRELKPTEISTPQEFKDWADTVKAIACDPVASRRLEAAKFEDGKREVAASFSFSAPDARTALERIDDRKRALNKPDGHLYERVLMVFTRTDINDAGVNKSTGERVLIENVSNKPLPIMYGTDSAEARIKSEIRDADENIYKKGFVVDAYLQSLHGKPSLFSVVHLHQIIDLD